MLVASIATLTTSAKMKQPKINPIDAALQAIGGTQSQLARMIGVTPAVVTSWRARGYVTQKHLRKAVEVTGLPAHILNPYIPAPLEVQAASKAEA